MLLAAERDIAGCAGASGSAAEEREAETMRTALEGAFAKMDCEILERAKREGGRDGSCALIALRIGTVPAACSHLTKPCLLDVLLCECADPTV